MLRHICLASVALAVFAFPASAQDVVADITAQLRGQGFVQIESARTWLGRTRILATSDSGTREIIVNPNTGEILRDLWQPSDDGTDVQVLNRESSGAAKGSGSDDASGSSGKDDSGNSGSGRSGSDDSGGGSSDNDGSDGGDSHGGDSGGDDSGSDGGSGSGSGSSGSNSGSGGSGSSGSDGGSGGSGGSGKDGGDDD